MRSRPGSAPRWARAERGASAATSASATNATATNDPLIPTMSAKPPNIGPTTKPRTARPKTVPSACPRRSRGTSTATHASAPAQVVALETPWTKRDSPRATGPPDSAKARLASASTVSPARTPRFGPIRPTRRPPGTPPTNAPAPYAPRSRPASSFVRSYVSAKWGRSGMIAPNSIASRNTTEPVRTTMRRTGRGYVGGRPILADAATDTTQQLRPRQPAPSGVCRAAGGGQSGGITLLRDPARGPKKTHRVGLASVQFTRSTFAEATAGRESLQPSALRARCTRKPTGAFGRRQARIGDNVSQIATIAFAAAFAGEFRSTQKRTEGGGSFVRPPDRPPPKRLPVGGPSTSGAPSSVHTGHYGPVIVPSSGNRFRKSALCEISLSHSMNLRLNACALERIGP